MTVKNGDMVKINYTGYLEDGAVFDTSDEAVAKEKNVHNPQIRYEPLAIAVGKHELIKGFDAALIGMKKGEPKEFTLAPAEAYGDRNANLVKVVPLHVFKESKTAPVPGMLVNLDGLTAKVQSVDGGRVRVDFNHPLAGKKLRFKVTVIEVFTEVVDKVKVMVQKYFPEDTEVVVDKDHVTVTPQSKVVATKEYGQQKAMFIMAMFRNMDEIKRISFNETFEKNYGKKE